MTVRLMLDLAHALPEDAQRATLVGRAWVPGARPGPSPVALFQGEVFDISTLAATSCELLNARDPVSLIRGALGSVRRIGATADVLANSCT